VVLLLSTIVVLVAVFAGVALAKNVFGTNGDDVLRGTVQADDIRGKGGNDELYAGAGNDKLYGGNGRDKLYGHDDNDVLKGGFGGDYLRPGAGRDNILGGPGNDLIETFRDEEPDFINCGGDYDTAYVQSGDYIDGQRASTLVGTTVLSCERVFVNGILVINTPR
jgi:Ca2+-binding RTX toxin-like protein